MLKTSNLITNSLFLKQLQLKISLSNDKKQNEQFYKNGPNLNIAYVRATGAQP